MRAGNDLGSGRIGVLVGRIALPSMLAQFISVLYSIVDRIFIGQIPGEGALALAGAGVCGPVVTMVGSVAFLVGVGGAPLLSIKRGEGAGRRSGDLRHHRPKLHARCDDAAGRHHGRNAVYFKL